MDFLEAFWETPVGRLGESNAQGWNKYVETKGEVPTAQPLTEIGTVIENFILRNPVELQSCEVHNICSFKSSKIMCYFGGFFLYYKYNM